MKCVFMFDFIRGVCWQRGLWPVSLFVELWTLNGERYFQYCHIPRMSTPYWSIDVADDLADITTWKTTSIITIITVIVSWITKVSWNMTLHEPARQVKSTAAKFPSFVWSHVLSVLAASERLLKAITRFLIHYNITAKLSYSITRSARYLNRASLAKNMARFF
jgi:hypothetical protein